MNLNFSWINLLVLFGALQALIFSIVLLFNKKHPGAKFLAMFVFVLAYNGFETFNWTSGLDKQYLFFDMFCFITIYAAGPSLFLYVTTLLYPERKFSARQIGLHFGWMGLQFFSRIAILSYHILWINDLIKTDIPPGKIFDWSLLFSEEISVAMFLGYLVATIYQFRKAKKTTGLFKAYSKDVQSAAHKWINSLLIAMIILGVLWPITILIPRIFEIEFGPHYYPIEICLVVLIYWLVMRGYHYAKLITPRAGGALSALGSNFDAEHVMSKLKQAFEDGKLYLDPDVNLKKVSSYTGLPSKTISLMLNQYHESNFNDFVNRYRIEEVKRRLIDTSNNHFTISGIALESGFNSQATFQRAFKSTVGVTPREYINLQIQKTA
ncbi:MAG TPA: helix-turn-helix domain-containing protein [Chryseolinea sp.]